ncbi:outer-membrane lipoprotein carrier protein LolA [Commensalibacter papalotli (ex Botero et al. 2024)]|uniref:Outer membrane lipoprotein-sorting protein (LolA) (PDB:1IWL) n=1 Tax=Commensalibacter papalotli (ex Botero et al. 2024) TaxID=2972766 RepID=A0ABM9HTQ1_9PROT|nr:outer-membrane lipoprotein carrier protein LolA [Commensalibacter papalotli (ex Botero et al. 2024)]CAI3956082.1 Outer membrane lipoprotein-sorting protein (LolA) (PDB:1IWL) [Commensalibacter papalotli (ex Botero et al. 2024)]CAI3956248.1 Outer membrane lipoprotein-sorting protein (LolA) (PDB:1IWL) [Commensalibacter papalotli (ex Botero et al. 2024)]
MKWMRRSVLLLLPMLLAACQNGQELRPTCELTAITQVESYLNNPKGFEGQFTQTWPDGGKSTGRIVYEPGKLRLNYEYPAPMIVVAKDKRMVAKDFSNQSVTHIGLSRNPLGLMLKTPVHLSKPILVTNVQHKNGLLQISLASSDNPSQGLLTLLFIDQNGQLTLRQMQAVDVRQRRSIMDLENIQEGIQVPASYFAYPDGQG